MSTVTASGPNYSVDNQIGFIVQWFRTWSELQKDDFVEILAQRLGPGKSVNGLVNGMQKLDTESKRVSLFSCQMKLFKEWWDTWSEGDKENLTSRLKDSDPKFWVTVQEELNGTRKNKLEDDFFTTVNICVSTSETNAGDDAAVVTTNGDHEEANENNVTISSNGGVTNVTVTTNGHQETEDIEDADSAEQSG